MKYLLILILALLVLTGCGTNNHTISTTQEPGKIQFSMVPVSLAKVTADASALPTDSTDVELGTLRTSKAFYFIIKNVGGSPIENLQITTNNSNVTMTPGYIPVLETDGNSAITQIAELDLIHGTDLGTRKAVKSLLPYGRSVTTLYFDGISNGEPFHEEFIIGYQAIYIDLELIDSSTSALIGPEFEYNGASCTLSYMPDRYDYIRRLGSVGDTIPGVEGLPVTEDINYHVFMDTDCVIKQMIPTQFQ